MTRKKLEQGWRIRQMAPSKELDWLLASQDGPNPSAWITAPNMPSMVHSILVEAGRIDTPWLPGKAAECLWVAERDWVYSTRFQAETIPEYAALLFGGLDTIVDIWLNGRLLASHESMYAPFRLDISGLLVHENILVLHFHSVFDLSSGSAVPIRFVNDDPCRRVRRANENYTEYLGAHPYFSRVGVFGDIVLETSDGSRIDDPVLNVRLSEDLSLGSVDTSVSGFAALDGLSLQVTLLAPDGKKVASQVQVLPKGAFALQLIPEIKQPELWWPRGYGKQTQYRVETALLDPWGQAIQTETAYVGFRRVAMPKPLHFEVNGKPVRLWGANWVVPRWETAVWDHARASSLLDIAEEGNMNAFRVWGCTEPPDDDFYQMADARGFMIWQDFTELPLFADDASLGLCKRESLHMIMRLKHHACIFIWGGGNEQLQWHEEEFGGPGGPWPGKRAAEHTVALSVAELDPQRPYIPNSPYFGIDSNDPRQWDTHGYTNIWYIPGYDYLNFASEDTRIAAPDLKSLKRFFAPEHLWPQGYSPTWKPNTVYPWPETWNHYTSHLSWKKTGPIEEYYDAGTPEELVYRLGMAEAQYYRETIERQRQGRPSDIPPGYEASQQRVCGGYLAWKLNDSWPQVYSSKVDYFLEPLIPYNVIRRAYAPILVSIEVGTFIRVWVTNDTTTAIEGQLEITLFHMEKNTVTKKVVLSCRVEPDKSEVAARLEEQGIGSFFRENVILARLLDGKGKELGRSVALMDIERRLPFPEARLSVRPENDELVITTDYFARSICLSGDDQGDDFGWRFDDNWFDLLPGEEKRVRIKGCHDSGMVSARAFYSPHVTSSRWQHPSSQSKTKGN